MSKPPQSPQSLSDVFDADKHKELDAQVMEACSAMASSFGKLAPYTILSIVVRFSSGLLDPKFTELNEAVELLINNKRLAKMLKKALKEKQFAAIRNLAVLRKPNQSSESAILPTSTAAAKAAWTTKFHGDYHEVMLKNINSMDRKAHYANSAAIIQSSGSGKSRTVDALADLVFTIPFNLRHLEEHGSAAYPPQDACVKDYLCDINSVKSIAEAQLRAHRFLSHLFLEVAKEVKQVFSGRYVSSTQDLAHTWKCHLSKNENRTKLYERVVQACREAVPDQALPKNQLLHDLRNVHSQADNVRAVEVILYFDEAHELKHVIKGNPEGKTLYDALWSILGLFDDDAIFTLFLSTQSSLTLLAPAAEHARSSRQQKPHDVQPPITEMPFDCHPCFPLRPGQFKLEDLKELPFLARFGRPLFWTMIEAAKESQKVVDGAMNLARTKLIYDDKLDKSHHSTIAMLAVLDVLITIDYEPKRVSAIELEMVASHLRVAFSVPRHRLFIRSGYPSEPFIAEAASRQMHHYLQSDNSSMIGLLAQELTNGLIDCSQKGEVVMRLLLRMAYMNAIGTEQSGQLNFSVGCSFLTFLQALFPANFHDIILQSNPETKKDESLVLENAFKHAVVRFTHFVKAADDSVVKSSAMVAGFVRGSAFIGHNTQEDVDIIIPILLEKDAAAIDESVMSAMFIQVKRRKKAGTINAYNIEEKRFGFFPKEETTELRPYVTLVVELGVNELPANIRSHVVIGGRDKRASSRLLERRAPHPKYSIRAYGCTDKTWGVIPPEHCDRYEQVLGMRGLFVDHPRADEDSLKLVRNMLPYWDSDISWFSEPSNAEMVQPTAEVADAEHSAAGEVDDDEYDVEDNAEDDVEDNAEDDVEDDDDDDVEDDDDDNVQDNAEDDAEGDTEDDTGDSEDNTDDSEDDTAEAEDDTDTPDA
ncbi:hypothetical protein F5I97DRAFT_59418 [Phlebopus sp. FC_14]|nr:hypothetical protein F5I97DRAFT_59418 [Phlebopus sp. FC_14]